MSIHRTSSSYPLKVSLSSLDYTRFRYKNDCAILSFSLAINTLAYLHDNKGTL
jgi:hypothetical protein